MFSRIGLAAAVASFGFAVLASRGAAQGRGGGGIRAPIVAPRAPTPAVPPHNSHPFADMEEHDHGRLFLNGAGYLFPPFYYPWDDYDQNPESETRQEAPRILVIPLQAEPPLAPAVSPAPTLLLENHGGQWVRVPTGNEIPAALQPAKPDSGSASPLASSTTPRSGYAEVPQDSRPTAPLPPAVIVYRDGRTEELTKYMIQGDDLYTTSDYYSTGAWSRKIPLSELNIPASVKLNKERGAKFNLPSSPNEVAVRF